MRNYSLADHICLKTEGLLRFLGGMQPPDPALRPYPAEVVEESALPEAARAQAAGFMRVNYAGEVCAQALYQGQALMTEDAGLRQQLEKAGLEEKDHLYWCQRRLQELGSRVSLLNPFWYAGAFVLGVAAGKWGDKWSLGFLAETERQVVRHLEGHLEKLPVEDQKTRKILETMK